MLQPPKMNMLGALTFTPEDRKALSAWLEQEGWPRGTMNIVMLEGYLVALLAWPVRVQPGAWLPAIWGQAGWKVAAKIDSQEEITSAVLTLVAERESRGPLATLPKSGQGSFRARTAADRESH